jgi:hypothetical protein
MTTRFAARSYVPGVTVQMWWVTWEQVMDPVLSKQLAQLEALGDTFTGPADVLPLAGLRPVTLAVNAAEIINGLEEGNAVVLDPEFDIDDSPATDAEVGVWTLNVPASFYEQAEAKGRVSKLVSMGNIAALVLCEIPAEAHETPKEGHCCTNVDGTHEVGCTCACHAAIGYNSDGSVRYADDRIWY